MKIKEAISNRLASYLSVKLFHTTYSQIATN